MESLKLPLIPHRAISQRVGGNGLVDCRGVYGDVVFLFWTSFSTGSATVAGRSTGAAGGRVDRPVDDSRGGVVN